MKKLVFILSVLWVFSLGNGILWAQTSAASGAKPNDATDAALDAAPETVVVVGTGVRGETELAEVRAGAKGAQASR